MKNRVLYLKIICMNIDTIVPIINKPHDIILKFFGLLIQIICMWLLPGVDRHESCTLETELWLDVHTLARSSMLFLYCCLISSSTCAVVSEWLQGDFYPVFDVCATFTFFSELFAPRLYNGQLDTMLDEVVWQLISCWKKPSAIKHLAITRCYSFWSVQCVTLPSSTWSISALEKFNVTL